MGATIRSKTGRQFLRKLSARLSRMREKVDGVEVVAGLVKGKSSPESIFKGIMNEFGHANAKGDGYTPARPFVQQSVPFVKENVHFACETFSMKGFDGFLRNVGDAMSDGVKESVQSQDFVELKQSTIDRKGHDTILVEKGDMYGNITSQVRRAQ